MASGDEQGGGFKGLLGNPLFNVGLGLLSASGPSAVPLSTGQRLAQGFQAGNQLQLQAFENRAAREKLRQQAERRRLGSEVDSLVSGLGPQTQPIMPINDSLLPDFMSDIPLGFQQQPGLLSNEQAEFLQTQARVDPEGALQQTGEVLFPSDRSQTSLVRNLQAAGIDPRSEEGQEIIRRNLSGNDISGQLAELQVLQTRQEVQRQQQALAKARREAQESQESSRKKRANLRRDVLQQINLGTEAAELLTDLEGTFGETGVGAGARNTLSGAVGAAQSMFGEKDSRAQEIASKAQRLNQIATDFGFENFNAFNAAISDQKAQIALGKDLSLDKTPQANRLALADRLEVALDQAQTEGIEVSNAPKVRKLIQRLRSGGQGAQFSSEEEVGAALDRGEIQRGDVVTVNGRRFRVE